MNIKKSSIRLYVSAKAVIALFLQLPGKDRILHIIKRVATWNEMEVEELLEKSRKDFSQRHRHIEKVFLTHAILLEKLSGDALAGFSANRKMLLGSLFTKEYSIQAAALFNPSIVAHPDQQNLLPGELRFIMSLRATGEGHISSIVFQTGVVDELAALKLDPAPKYQTALQRDVDAKHTKSFITARVEGNPEFDRHVLKKLTELFTAAEAIQLLEEEIHTSASMSESINIIKGILDANYELKAEPGIQLPEMVLFPVAKSECMGMEDVRMVRFYDGATWCYYGTYTAYDGHRIQTKLIETRDFRSFSIRSLYGAAISDKGMALFPEKINGRYAMISRQGGEVMNIMFSDDLYRWDTFQLLMAPEFAWEAVQVGNCGSPIRTDVGWLLLTHGVGVMRTYVISALLLDLSDPTIIIGRLRVPLLSADENEREGYVPNVVYTCGFLLHGKTLIIPYALADSATAFATVSLDELLNEIKIQ